MFNLTSGQQFDPYRSRSEGVLNDEELAFCRRFGIPLGYDPAQIGWVALTGLDDFASLSRVDRLLSDLEHELAESVAVDLEEVSAGRLEIEEARSRALERALNLAGVNYGTLRQADQIHSRLHREAARYFPIRVDLVQSGAFRYRPWTEADVRRYAEIFGNPNVWKYLPDQAPTQMNTETAEAMIVVANEDPRHDVYAVERDDREVIGQVRLLYNQEYPHMLGAEIAYLLGEQYWGKGLMSEILGDFTGKILAERGFDFLCAWIHPDNVGSVRCALQSGYIRDCFHSEEQLAVAVDRAGFQRYKRYA